MQCASQAFPLDDLFFDDYARRVMERDYFDLPSAVHPPRNRAQLDPHERFPLAFVWVLLLLAGVSWLAMTGAAFLLHHILSTWG